MTRDLLKYRILFNFASRHRPEKLKDAITNILHNVNNIDEMLIIIKLDDDDATVNDELIDDIYHCMNTEVVRGLSNNKIHAINRGVPNTGWDILVNMSDDMEFTVKGFDDVIRKDFGDDLDKFIHYPDGKQNENLSTLSIFGKPYYDRFGYVYHPSYSSLWCDVEATDVAKDLKRYVYLDKKIFVHNHPCWGLTEMDSLYARNESYNDKDHRNYQQRRANNFLI